MRFTIVTTIWLIAAFSFPTFAGDAVGLSTVYLPGISDRHELGLLYETSVVPEKSLLGFVDFVSLEALLFPSLKLIAPSTLVVEDNQPVLKKGNDLDFDSKSVTLLIVSPRFGSCLFSRSLCVSVSPLSLPIFSGGSQLRIYSSPIVGAEFHWPGYRRRSWKFGIENIVFQNQTLLTVGYLI